MPLRRWLTLSAAVLLAGCSQEPTTSVVPGVATVQVSPVADTLVSIGQTRQLSAVVKDASGATLSGRTITWTSSSSGVATVQATTGLVTAVGNGAATIQASVEGVNGSAQVFVAQLVATVTVTPGNVGLTGLGLTQQFTAVAKDSGGTGVTIPRFLWLSSDQAVAVVDSVGLARSRHSGQTVITAAAQGIPGNALLSVSQSAAGLAFRVSPPASTTAGDVFAQAVQVEVRDGGGAVVPDAQLPVTLTASAGTLKGTTTVNAISGVASFSGLWLENAGSGLTLSAASSGLNPAASAAFGIAPAAPAAVEFVNPPANDTAGGPLNVSVRLKDRFGNTATQRSDSVYLHVYPGGLAGTTATPAVAGIATFADVNVQLAGYHTMSAVRPGLDSATSGVFTISPASARALVITNYPLPAYANAPFDGEFGVTVVDTFYNQVNTTHAVTLEMHHAPWLPAHLGGLTTDTAYQGAVGFAAASLDRPTSFSVGGSYLLAVTSAGLRPDSASVPVALGSPLGLSLGQRHSCAVTEHYPTRTVFCWGANDQSQLGNADVSAGGDSVAAVAVGGQFAQTPVWPSGVLSLGQSHTCVLTDDSKIYCWGANDQGQLGIGTSGSPVVAASEVGADSTWVAVAAGGAHSCALTTYGNAYCWGDNSQGQLGDSAAPADQHAPVAVKHGLRYTWITAGAEHSCAIRDADSAAYCWGRGDLGQLGQGAFAGSDTAVLVSGGHKFVTITAGNGFTCGVTADVVANVYCWGVNSVGQLGNNDAPNNNASPQQINATVATGGSPAEEAGYLSAGDSHACAIATDGDLKCWGDGTDGQLGPNGGSGSALPVSAMFASSYHPVRVAAGGAHTCAISFLTPPYNETHVYCWGRNAEGQLGIGSTASTATPAYIIQYP